MAETSVAMPDYHLEAIRLKNFRKFEALDLAFARRFTLLIGRNGAGKSSIIAALAVALDELIPNHVGGWTVPFEADDVHEKVFETGTQIFLEPQFPSEVEADAVVTDISTGWKRTRDVQGFPKSDLSSEVDEYCSFVTQSISSGSPDLIPVIALFGIDRLSWEVDRKPEFTKSGSRFRAITNALAASKDFNTVLDWWKTEEFSSIQRSTPSQPLAALKKAILGCTDGATEVIYDLRDEQVLVKISDQWMSLSHASSGYKQFIMLVASLAWRAAILNPHLDPDQMLEVPGIVVIDEIDAHLHPEWQRRVVYDLMMIFPNMQFIASTHSPFVIQGLPPSEDTRIVRLDDLASFQPEAMTLEQVAEYVQQVSNVERSYVFETQSAKIQEALTTTIDSPQEGQKELEKLLSSEPFDPATKALLELEKMSAEERVAES